MERYIETLLKLEKTCKELKKDAIALLYEEGETESPLRGLICYSPRYQSYFRPIKRLIEVIELFGIEALEKDKNVLLGWIRQLGDPTCVYHKPNFDEFIDRILESFSDKSVKEMIKNRLSILNSTEIDRLNEAIHCFVEDCNYSAVVMSVSAIEFRLLSLMKSIQPNPKLEKMTLGQLINEYLDHKEKYNRVIPEKHEPLLEYCNTYRIFSVHPKKERINKSVATSIIHMTFQFLLDKKLAQKTET